MKNLISFITLLIFLHSNTDYMISADYQLYDAGMEHLLAGTPYYVVPADSDRGGVLSSYENNSTCYAVREPIDDLPSSLAMIFNHAESDPLNWLTASKDLNIKFESDRFCPSSSSTVLQVNNVDEATGQHFITAGGVEGNPGCGTVNSWFQIKKIGGEYSYKLVYCPSVCDLVNTCKDVGLFRASDGFPRLVLSDDYPILIRFQKANPCRSNKF